MTSVTPMKPVRKRVFSRKAVTVMQLATSSVLFVTVIVLVSLMMTAKPQDLCPPELPDLCPPELPVLRKGYCYGLFSGNLSGIEAQRQCRSYKADLVWILDREEQTFIDRTFAKRGDGMWIGCNDKDSEGNFVWNYNNQPVSFTNWFAGEPNDGDAYRTEDCCMIGHWNMPAGRWNDFSCEIQDSIHKYICKK